MDHSNSPPVFLAVLASLSPVFSSQLFPEWQTWSLPSHRSQNPLDTQQRRQEDPSRGHDNFPREISRVSRENGERYFQYLNIPSKKVKFNFLTNTNCNSKYWRFQGIWVWMESRRPISLHIKIWARKGSQIQNKGRLLVPIHWKF